MGNGEARRDRDGVCAYQTRGIRVRVLQNSVLGCAYAVCASFSCVVRSDFWIFCVAFSSSLSLRLISLSLFLRATCLLRLILVRTTLGQFKLYHGFLCFPLFLSLYFRCADFCLFIRCVFKSRGCVFRSFLPPSGHGGRFSFVVVRFLVRSSFFVLRSGKFPSLGFFGLRGYLFPSADLDFVFSRFFILFVLLPSMHSAPRRRNTHDDAPHPHDHNPSRRVHAICCSHTAVREGGNRVVVFHLYAFDRGDARVMPPTPRTKGDKRRRICA
ncbi:hypothetical protein BDZ97DRAFT_608739 [Flammula alnicola]|nr:hypothetical protein BDZ97DRAFT_608739 [Flammula alnicola]